MPGLVVAAAPWPTANISVMHPQVLGVPGATASNVLVLTNTSDSTYHVSLTLMAPPAFRLMTRLPASVRLLPHSTHSLLLVFWIDQRWADSEATIQVAAQPNTPAPASILQYVIYQGQPDLSVVTYTLENERPYLPPGVDTLSIVLRLANTGSRPQTVRLHSFSLPAGLEPFAPLDTVTIPPRREIVVRLPHRVRPSLQWDRHYEVVIEVKNQAGILLGSVICRPVLLSSVRRVTTEGPAHGALNGLSVGLAYYGSRGLVPEVRGWGQTALYGGTLNFQADYMHANPNAQGSGPGQLRDTHLQYERGKTQLRVGNLTDYHELMLVGIGAKVAASLGTINVEGWAVRNQTNWFTKDLGPVADQTYSLRLTRSTPLTQAVTYSLSSSHYKLSRTNRVGFLTFGTIDWKLNAWSRLRVLAGHSAEYAPGATVPAGSTRRTAVGWALGGNYDWQDKLIDVHASTYLSSPVYGGLQRGASLVEHRLMYKRWPNTPLSYRFSRMVYDQTMHNYLGEVTRRYFGSTRADVTLARRFNYLTASLQPYYWAQGQTMPDYSIPGKPKPGNVRQASESYRLLTALTYEKPGAGRIEVGVDVGRYQNQAPATNRFEQNTYQLHTSAFRGNFSLMGQYQRGPFLLNDLLPGTTNPQDFRQWTVSPSYQFAWFSRRLRGSMGVDMLYRTSNKANPWAGMIRHTAEFAVNDNLSLRWSVNTSSLAEQVGDIVSVPWQGTQFRMEAIRQFQRLPLSGSHRLQLRFYEDANGDKHKDASEPWLTGLVVNVNQTPLLSDRKGSLSYKMPKAGLCTIQAVSKLASGEPVWFSDTISVIRSVRRDIPIRKTWRVSGQVRSNRSQYENGVIDLERYRIEAYHAGGETFRTYADAEGRFNLFLPPGRYQLRVVQGQLSAPVLLKTMDYLVEPGRPCPAVVLDVETGTRPVKFKRFSK